MLLDTLKLVLLENVPILTILFVTLVTVRYFYLKNHREHFIFYKECLTILGAMYIILLFQLVTKVDFNQSSGYNLVPFVEIFRYDIGSTLFNYNVFGNILSFLVFGILISSYIRPKNALPIFLSSTFVSATIEFVQYNIGRSFDVDDIILNVIGGLLGYLLYVALVRIKKYLPKILQSDTIYNILCLIILAVIIIFLLRFWRIADI